MKDWLGKFALFLSGALFAQGLAMLFDQYWVGWIQLAVAANAAHVSTSMTKPSEESARGRGR